MAIVNVDQLLLDETNSILTGVLANSNYLKNNILNSLPSDTVDSFINEYCTDSNHLGKKINTYFAFPTTAPTTAFLLFQFKGSEEDDESSALGSVEGQTISNSVGQAIHEKLVVKTQNATAWVEPTQEIHSVISIPQTTNYNLQDNKVYLTYIPPYDDGQHKIDLYYNTKVEKDGYSSPIGINTNEGVTIDFVCSNISTIRCLSAIFTYIRIYLKQTLEENYNVYLPTIEMNGMDVIEDTKSNGLDSQPLFYRRLTVTYKVTQTIDQNTSLIENIKTGW